MPHERVRTDTVYTFDELSDSAKDSAREWFRIACADDFASFHADSVLEDAARLADIIGINLRQRPIKLMNGSTRMEPDVFWSVGDRGAGVSYSASYAYRKGAVRALEMEAPSTHNGKEQKSNAELNCIARALADVQQRNFYKLQASVHHNRRVRDFAIEIDVEHADDNDKLSEADAAIVRECLEDFASWLHRRLEDEWEYQNSDEVVDENIRANEYEFTEDGKRA